MKKILIVNSNYYQNVSKNLVLKAKNKLDSVKFKTNIIEVPGIYEIPIAIRKNINKFDGFVALGCVVKGQTPHFDLICLSTFNTIQNISVTYKKPITNGIITAINKKQALERCGAKRSNKTNKGLEAARAVISIISNGAKKI